MRVAHSSHTFGCSWNWSNLSLMAVRRWIGRIVAPAAIVVSGGLTNDLGQAWAEEANIPAKQVAPAEKTGQLMICGGGVLPTEILDRFVAEAGGANARIVLIPTASKYAGTPELEAFITYWRSLAVKSMTLLHTDSKDEANRPEFAAPLAEATGVWFSGGVQSRLTDVYLDTAVHKAVKHVVSRGGIVGGTSAGAAIMSPVMIRGGYPKAEVGRGLGLLEGTIVDQHFLRRNRHARLFHALEQHRGMVGLGIDEGTAMLVCGDQFEVLGESKVVICHAQGPGTTCRLETIGPGQPTNLAQWCQAAAKHASTVAQAPTAKESEMPQTGR